MSTIVYLVRHANHDLVGRVLVGRGDDLGLSARGFAEAATLAAHFADQRIDAVQSSPRLRARQTAHTIANWLPLLVVPAIDELNAGEWTGLSFEALQRDTRWHRWNAERGSACVPAGESMQDVQRRIVVHLSHLAVQHPGQRLVIVSHAEVIRAAILHYRNVPLNEFARVQLEPASITTLRLSPDGGDVVRENELLHMSAAA